MATRNESLSLLSDSGQLSAEDRAAIAARIDERVMNAQSVEELFGKSSALDLTDIEGESVTVTHVRILESAEQYRGKGLGVYMAIELADGRVVTTGAEGVVKRLAVAAERGWLPVTVRFYPAPRPTAAGFVPWNVELAD